MAITLFGLTDNLPTFAWLSCILGCLYYSVRSYTVYRARHQIISRHGCKPPSKYPVWDPFFGLDVSTLSDSESIHLNNSTLTGSLRRHTRYQTQNLLDREGIPL